MAKDSNDSNDEEEDEIVYIAVKDESNNDEKMTLIYHMRKNDTWIIDSGCSHHMTGDKTKFEYFEDYDGGSVRFGNNEPCCIKGRGRIPLTKELICDNAYWVEGLKHNLLSVAQLLNNGIKVEFMHGKTRLLDGKGKLIRLGTQTKGNLFYLELGECSCFIAQVEESWLWHKRLCHVNFDNLVKIRKFRKVKGIPNIKKPEVGLCKNCQIEKMGKTSFKSKNYQFEDILEIVHTDLCGPIGIESYIGEKFFILFVDDYSRMMAVMYLRNKSEAFEKFKWYLARVEKEIGKRLKCLRSNRGGEFISHEFNNFCIERGIKRQVSAPGTPQQNGIAERRNKSIMNCARTLMIEKSTTIKY